MSIVPTKTFKKPDRLSRTAMPLATPGLINVDGGGDCLVKTKAQVMTKDDGTGMWIPLLGGGMSIVALSRVQEDIHSTPDQLDPGCTQYQYHIEGRKIDSEVIVLRCFVTKELKYTSPNPTFHHWVTRTDQCGLVFQSASEANEFKKMVIQTVQELCGDQKKLNESIKLEIVTSNVPSSFVEETEVGKLLLRSTTEAARLHVGDASIEHESSDSLSMCSLQEAVPAVPPRRAVSTLTAGEVMSKPFYELSRLVPHYVDHSVPVAQVVQQPTPFHASGSSGTSDGSSSIRQSPSSPPVPPRPDIARSDSSRPVVVSVVNRSQTGVKTLSNVSSLSGMAKRERSHLLLSSQLASAPGPGLPQQPIGSTRAGTNYVYFTESNVVPPTSPVAVKNAKPKESWLEAGGAKGGIPRDCRPRLAEAFHFPGGMVHRDDSVLGGAYVQLATPSDGASVSQAHEYCYPSLDTVMTALNAPPSSSSSSSHHRNTSSPPPLPTKSKLNWRDCRKKRKEVQQRGQTSQRPLASVARLTYGTGGQSYRRPATASAVVVTSHLSLDESVENQSSRRARASSLLCLLPCTGRPCPPQ